MHNRIVSSMFIWAYQNSIYHYTYLCIRGWTNVIKFEYSLVLVTFVTRYFSTKHINLITICIKVCSNFAIHVVEKFIITHIVINFKLLPWELNSKLNVEILEVTFVHTLLCINLVSTTNNNIEWFALWYK